MNHVKFDHVFSFYMLRKVFTHFYIYILGLGKAIGFLCPLYLEMGNFSVLSISLEVLDLVNRMKIIMRTTNIFLYLEVER